MKEKLTQGTRIGFNLDGKTRGTGMIVGVALSTLPVIGYTYIVEPDIPITNETYPYSHFVANETQIEIHNI
jgi:hypothetical protein